MSELLDYQKHVKSDRLSNAAGGNANMSYCGKHVQVPEYFFVSAEHCLANSQDNGRLLPCPDCRDEMVRLLQKE